MQQLSLLGAALPWGVQTFPSAPLPPISPFSAGQRGMLPLLEGDGSTKECMFCAHPPPHCNISCSALGQNLKIVGEIQSNGTVWKGS